MAGDFDGNNLGPLSRRSLLRAGAGLAGGALLPSGLILPAFAEDQPALGTWPDGSKGDSVFVGISVPRTGTYAAAGEDLIKGYELAIEHLNNGSEMQTKISPNIKKGVLGKQVKYGIADSEAKPNTAVQNLGKFISDNKAVMVTGSVSSAEAVADNKSADREKVIYLSAFPVPTTPPARIACATRSANASTARPRRRRSLPVLIKNARQEQEGRLSDARLHLWPHRAEIDGGVSCKEGGWTTATDQVSPLGHDRLQLLPAERRQQRRRRRRQHQFRPRRGSVDQAGQAVRHPRQDDAGRALQHAVPRQGSRRRHHAGRARRDRLLVDARGQVPAREDVQRRLPGQIRQPSGMGRQPRLHADRNVGRRGRAGQVLLSARRH